MKSVLALGLAGVACATNTQSWAYEANVTNINNTYYYIPVFAGTPLQTSPYPGFAFDSVN